MHDAHTHIKHLETLNYLAKHQIPCIANAASVEEFQFLDQHRYEGMYISCGVHPWYVDQTDFNQLFPYIKKADFLGEIGLDKPWCDTPFELQKEMFKQQLEICHQPTILHTKGYEKEVYDIIRLFPRKYIVHWYSCMDYIEDFIQLDCYFTIGPSVGIDKAVSEVARLVPLNRLLIETDGLDAVAWAYNKNIELEDYQSILDNMVKTIADIKKISVDELKSILRKNFKALTCI